MKSLYGWLVIAVASILSFNSIDTGASLINAVRTLHSGEGVGDVKGTVVDYEDEPLEGAYVWIEKEGIHTWSGRDGNFTLKGVGAGLHTINFWKLGYERVSTPFSVYPGSVVERWGEINDVGRVELRRKYEVNETSLDPATLRIMINHSGSLMGLSYTLSTPGGEPLREGALESIFTLEGLSPGTYVLNLSGDNITRRYTFYLPPGGKELQIEFERESGEQDLRSLSTLSVVPSGEKVPEWIAVNLTDRCTGWSLEGVFNVTGTIIIAVREGLYNLTVGSPYTGSMLYTNISTPSTLEINQTYIPVKEKQISMSLVVVIAVFYVIIGVFGVLGAVLVYMRKRFRTALLSLILLMFAPTPSVYICSIGVILGLAAIFMLYRIKGEFDVGGVSGSSSDAE